jgi:hypothetical protein
MADTFKTQTCMWSETNPLDQRWRCNLRNLNANNENEASVKYCDGCKCYSNTNDVSY